MCPNCGAALLPGQSYCSMSCVRAAFPGWRGFSFRSEWGSKGKDAIAKLASPRGPVDPDLSTEEAEAP